MMWYSSKYKIGGLVRHWLMLVLSVLVIGSALTPLTYADTAVNLMSNPSAETLQNGQPTNWTADDWGTSTTSLATTTDAHTGTVALTVTTSGRTGDGDAKWMPDAVAVTAGQQYTYSDYSKASIATQLVAAYTGSAGSVSYAYLSTVQASADWQANSATFTVPTGVQQVRILHILAANGTLTTDDFSLTAQVAVTTPAPTGDNLIANPSMTVGTSSAPAGWQSDSWGTNTAAATYVTNDGHSDTTSAKVQISNYTDGDAKWYFAPVSVQPNSGYTFSDYYKSSVATSLIARFDDGTGAYSYSVIATPAASTAWAQASGTFTTPATAKYVTVLHVLAANGTLQTDDASLVAATTTTTPTPTPTSGNLFTNPSVETVSTASKQLPSGWQHDGWGTNTASYTYPNNGHTGSRSIKAQISSYTSGTAYWSTSPVAVTGGQLYDFTDYYKSNVPTEVDASVIMADGSEQDVYLGTAFASPNSWTKFEMQFTMPAGAKSISVIHDIYEVGYLQTDDYSLQAFSYQGFNRALVSITDDDGFASVYNNGLPVLQKYGLPSTSYIISSYVGAPNYMTAAQLAALKTAGVEIGSHSVDHADLSTQTANAQDKELKNSQTVLQTLLGISVTDYAAPYGAYNQQIVTDAQKYYGTYRGVQAGYNARNNFDAMNLQVQNITSSTTVAQVQSWLQQAAQTNTWLILVYHEIDTNPTDATYNTLPADFDAQMAAVKNSGLTAETVAQALAEVKAQL